MTVCYGWGMSDYIRGAGFALVGVSIGLTAGVLPAVGVVVGLAMVAATT